ncbi:aldo/keto reductase [Micrococcales bacterium 31B]|nr:aldo/keto reductase [Micrococcales bacterium 31B]
MLTSSVHPTERRLIPRTRLNIGALGYGAAGIGNLYREIDPADARESVDTAWELGIRYFDTAPHYGLGLSERRLGEALAERPRGDYVLSTKVGRLLAPNPQFATHPGLDDEGFHVPNDVVRRRDYSRDGVLRSIESSLIRLRTDYLDVVYIHDPDEFVDEALDGAAPALSALRDEGVIGAWGVGMNQWEAPLRFVQESDPNLIMLAGRFTLLEQPGLPLLTECMRREVGVVNVGVFNSGLLSKPRPAPDATYNYAPAPADLLRRTHEIADHCERHGVTLPAAAIAFAFTHPAVVSVALGMRTRAQVEQNVELAARDVPAALWDDLDRAGLLPRVEA